MKTLTFYSYKKTKNLYKFFQIYVFDYMNYRKNNYKEADGDVQLFIIRGLSYNQFHYNMFPFEGNFKKFDLSET